VQPEQLVRKRHLLIIRHVPRGQQPRGGARSAPGAELGVDSGGIRQGRDRPVLVDRVVEDEAAQEALEDAVAGLDDLAAGESAKCSSVPALMM
jgi:hypothetical protein